MDIYRLKEHLEMANLLGATLNVEERLRIDLTLSKLAQDNPDIEDFKFWGRIDGTIRSYYIIVGLNYQTYQFPHKTFFWATDPSFKFSKLIENLYDQHKQSMEKIIDVFVGQPSKVLLNLEGEEGEQADQQVQPLGEEGQQKAKQQVDSLDQQNIVLPKKNLTELNRLSIVVRAIQNQCQVVPVGSYKMSPQHSLIANDTFRCPNIQNSLDIKNWQHFRAPQTEIKKAAIQNQNVIFREDFLDGIQNDLPQGCWSIQSDCSGANITVRNLLWPGYLAYQKCNSKLFGSCYFGDGRKNVNLAFQL